MIDIAHWVMWLRGTDVLIGLPLIIAGLALLLGGWRMGLVCVVGTYAVLGGAVAYSLTAMHPQRVLLVGLAAVVLGAASLLVRRVAIPVLGGVIGGGMLMQMLASFGLQEWPLWIAGFVAVACVTALCYAHGRNVLIVVTSFEGAVLVLSGLVPVMSSSPGLFRFFESLTRTSDVFFPFVVLVPTAVGVFLQMADARNKDSGMTQA